MKAILELVYSFGLKKEAKKAVRNGNTLSGSNLSMRRQWNRRFEASTDYMLDGNCNTDVALDFGSNGREFIISVAKEDALRMPRDFRSCRLRRAATKARN